MTQNFAAGLLDEGDGALDEGCAAEVRLGFPFGRELLLDDVLSGDSGVIGAGNPERFVADHSSPTDDHVLDGVVEAVAHVQHGGHVRRWHHDHEGIAIASVAAAALLIGGKNPRVDPALVNRALYLSRVVLRWEIAKLLGCAHLRRKLTGANFSGKMSRLTRAESVRSVTRSLVWRGRRWSAVRAPGQRRGRLSVRRSAQQGSHRCGRRALSLSLCDVRPRPEFRLLPP